MNARERSGRAFPSHGRGRRFNPCSAHHFKSLFVILNFYSARFAPRSAPMFRPKKSLWAPPPLAICWGSSARQRLTDARRWLRPDARGAQEKWRAFNLDCSFRPYASNIKELCLLLSGRYLGNPPQGLIGIAPIFVCCGHDALPLFAHLDRPTPPRAPTSRVADPILEMKRGRASALTPLPSSARFTPERMPTTP